MIFFFKNIFFYRFSFFFLKKKKKNAIKGLATRFLEKRVAARP